MVTIVTRSGKGSPLTNSEVDSNFTNLNSGKLETSGGSVTGNLTISGSSATDLVRITQTGGGNALVVEDAANPDSTPFVVDTNGNVGVGTGSPSAKLHVDGTFYTTGAVQIDGVAALNNALSLGPSGGEGGEARFLNPTGGLAGMTIDVSSNDIGRIFGTNNNFYLELGQRAGTGGYVSFWTETSEKMRLIANGNFGVGTTAPGSKLDVKGTLRLSGSTSGYVGLAPAAAAGSVTYTLPSTDGTTGQFLSTNGSGTLSWATASSGASTGRLINVQVFTTSGTNTYTRSSGVVSALVIAVGGGGGGGAPLYSGTTATNGSSGGTTSFGLHVNAAGGSGGFGSNNSNGAGGSGGTGGSGATIAIAGAPGGSKIEGSASCFPVVGYSGFGGGQGAGKTVVGTTGGVSGVAGIAGVRGGGGSGASSLNYGNGGGGGQGETCIKYIATVGSTETVTIGSGGTGGVSGSGSIPGGGAGGAGYVIVYEYS